MPTVELPLGIILLVMLIVAVFSALLSHSVTRWMYRWREENLRVWQRQLTDAAGGPSSGIHDGAPFVAGAVADANRRASALLAGRR